MGEEGIKQILLGFLFMLIHQLMKPETISIHYKKQNLCPTKMNMKKFKLN